jgi:class 3 adenylate cyclase/tetratricopeptide (TPR) repeat protein
MSREALEGERKQVTVLFADIKSSLELLAGRDPEEARGLLDPVLDLMMQAVHRYEGTVNQVMGDGIMALFGVPLAQEDHALRACCAALRIQEAIGHYSDQTLRRYGVPIQVRVGVNSGEVVVRSIGSDLGMDYTAVGETTHLAGRLEQMAKPGTIVCGPATLHLAEGFLRYRSLGPIPIRGLAHPVTIAEVTGIEPGHIRFHVAVARGLSPFVGRRDEHAAIVRALERAAQGRGQILLLVGEAGIGKSRLCWEALRSLPLGDWLHLHAGGSSYSTQVPHAPLAAVLRTYCAVDDGDDPHQARDKVATRLAAVGATGPWILPAFLALLELPGDDSAWTALDPPRRRHFTTQAIVDWLMGESAMRPVVLLLEDLHWIDHGTQAVLDALAERVATCRILVLGNCRPEYADSLERRGAVTLLPVSPLSRSGAEDLLRQLLGDDPSLAALTALLAERAGGNPLFLEEMVRALVETGVLAGSPSAYRLMGSVDRVTVPPSVHAILAARIDRLAADDKHTLQTAAVIGDEVPLALLVATTAEAEAEVHARLTRLRDAGFLYEASLYPGFAYGFAHALVREVAYTGLIQDRRRTLHDHVLCAMEQLYAERLAEHVERLSQHAVAAGDWPKAVRYLREAGAKAATRTAYTEAAAHYEQAVAALERLPGTPENRATAIDLCFERRNALYPLGRIAQDREHLLAAMPAAEALGDERRLGWLLAYLARDTSLLGDPGGALTLGERALDIAARLGDHRLHTLTTAYLGVAQHARGEYRDAVRRLTEAIAGLRAGALLEPLGLPGPAAVFFRAWLAGALTRLGQFSEGRRRALEALDIAATARQPLSLAVAHYSVGLLCLFRLDLPAAIRALEESLEQCLRWSLRAWFPNIASHLGFAYARSGRLEEGLDLLQQAVDRMSSPYDASVEFAMFAQALVLAGRGDEARRHAAHALALAQSHQERGNEAVALCALGRVAAASDADVAEAARHYRAALTLATDLDMKPLAAECHAGLAELWAQTGDATAEAESRIAAEALRRTLDIAAPYSRAGA